MMVIRRRYCPTCHMNRPASADTFPHLACFLLTLLTCGFFAPVWAVLPWVPRGHVCNVCGSPANGRVRSKSRTRSTRAREWLGDGE